MSLAAALPAAPEAFRRQIARYVHERIALLPVTVQALLSDQHGREVGLRDPDHPHNGSPVYVANLNLGRRVRALTAARIGKAYDEGAIRDHAENYATLCARMHSLESRASFAVHLGVTPPEPGKRQVTREGAIARLDDPLWWRRQLRKVWTRSSEAAMRELGVVRRGRDPYASQSAVEHRAAQKRRARDFLERSVLVNEEGEQLELLTVAERSLANPALRRGEFMCRARGFETIARDLKHVAEFATLTAPSAFHAQLHAGGENPRFTRATVREAQAWLCRMWARARAKLKRLSVLFYGFRIAEPHHDGTPHWHLLLFVAPRHLEALRAVLRAVWLAEFADEPGARERRVKFETIDPARGSATGYVAKYVSKNIDGAGAIGGVEDSETGRRVGDGIERVDAWASVHGIRQFQQVGGPPVGLWREARRLRDEARDRDIERARRCADAGDWAGFVDAVGGVHCGRRTNLRLERAETGERNRYGEARPAVIVGLRYASAVELTRPHRWRIERKNSCAVPGVMNPPRSAARGREAGNLNGPSTSGLGESPGAARHAALSTRAGELRPGEPAPPPSALPSSLGPVGITVRAPHSGHEAPGLNEPAGWTNPNETSRAGPL